MTRAKSSGITLNEGDAATIKGMIKRGDRQHDIASYFGVNAGRIAEISTGQNFHWVQPADQSELLPKGAPGLILKALIKKIESSGKSIQELIRS